MKLAELLALRKHLDAKVKQLEPLQLQGKNGIFEVQTKRRSVNDSVDEVVTQVPKITLEEVTAEYDKYSKALRLADTKIQETNWTTEVEFDSTDLKV